MRAWGDAFSRPQLTRRAAPACPAESHPLLTARDSWVDEEEEAGVAGELGSVRAGLAAHTQQAARLEAVVRKQAAAIAR